MTNLKSVVHNALQSSLLTYRKINRPDAGETLYVVSTDHDVTLNLDLELQSAIISSLTESGIAARIVSEELKSPQDLVAQPRYFITIDPLDGTENAQRHKAPQASIVGVYDSLHPTFDAIVAAGVVELTSGEVWFADGSGCYKNNQSVRTSTIQKLDKKTQGIIDGYYPDNVERCKSMYQRARVRDYGSSAAHFAWLASGQVDAFVSLHQKNHEGGAGYFLITKAGGIVTDSQGNNLGPRPYIFEEKVSFIAASTKELHREILGLIQ